MVSRCGAWAYLSPLTQSGCLGLSSTIVWSRSPKRAFDEFGIAPSRPVLCKAPVHAVGDEHCERIVGRVEDIAHQDVTALQVVQTSAQQRQVVPPLPSQAPTAASSTLASASPNRATTRICGKPSPGACVADRGQSEVGAFYWTVPTPNIVNPGREEQGSVSV